MLEGSLRNWKRLLQAPTVIVVSLWCFGGGWGERGEREGLVEIAMGMEG